MASMDRLNAAKQPVQVFIQDTPAVLLIFDATLEEMHSGESEITDYPVEEGADHTDHVRGKPIEFSMKGMITDFPIIVDLPNNLPQNKTGQNSGSRVSDAYGFLEQARINADLVTVFTRFRTYESMVIRKIAVPREARIGAAAEFDLDFRQLTFGEVEITKAPKPRAPARSPKEDKGDKASKDVDTTTNRSLAKQGVRAIFGIQD